MSIVRDIVDFRISIPTSIGSTNHNMVLFELSSLVVADPVTEQTLANTSANTQLHKFLQTIKNDHRPNKSGNKTLQTNMQQ